MILKSRRAGRVVASKAKCILGLGVQLGRGQSVLCGELEMQIVLVEEKEEELTGGRSHGSWWGGRIFEGDECVYDDFSFLALGESAP